MSNVTIIEFLTARLDEDEKFARWAAEEVGDGHWQQRNVRIVTVADRDREVADYAIAECIEHIVRHDPARTLAECVAKGAVIAAHLSPRSQGALGGVIQVLAAVYSDHPDYQQEWRP